jgi:hypothetical protein
MGLNNRFDIGQQKNEALIFRNLWEGNIVLDSLFAEVYFGFVVSHRTLIAGKPSNPYPSGVSYEKEFPEGANIKPLREFLFARRFNPP